MERQTGSLKTSSHCQSCSEPLPAVVVGGTLQAGSCPKCHPTTPRATAAEVLPRVTGT